METWSLPSKLHKLIYKKEKHKALSFLSDITAINSDGFFTETDEGYLRYVGYFRVQLLLEWGHYREALAWACLECELYPENVDAILLKENIKQKINNLPKEQTEVSVPFVSDTPWGNIAGMRELKGLLDRDLILPFSDLETCKKYKLKIPHGYLFYGPPGCGKTELVKQIAKILNFNFMMVTPSSGGYPTYMGSQIELTELFHIAEQNKPSLLFFDEIESIAPDRDARESYKTEQNRVEELLTLLNTAFERKILVVGATNFIKKIDPSVIRAGRMDKKVFIGPPDFEARIEAFKLYLKDIPHQVKGWDYLGEESQHMSFADIRFIVDEAKRKAKVHSLPIDLNHLMQAVIENPGKLKEKELKKYEG